MKQTCKLCGAICATKRGLNMHTKRYCTKAKERVTDVKLPPTIEDMIRDIVRDEFNNLVDEQDIVNTDTMNEAIDDKMSDIESRLDGASVTI